jgi:hypothetical protein
MDGKRFNNRFSEPPVCKFGPGGEFIQELSENAVLFKSQPPENPLGKVLEVIAGIIGVAVGPELLIDQPQQQDNAPKEQIYKTKAEKTTYEHIQSEFGHHHSQTTGRAAGNRNVSGQPMLFADDGRTGPFAGCKSAHRIRTHRRASRKRHGRTVPRQGTLFTAYETGKKTA